MTKPQEILDPELNMLKETFIPFTPNKHSSRRNWFLAVTSFEATNSVFNITDENSSFSINTPGFWRITNYIPY